MTASVSVPLPTNPPDQPQDPEDEVMLQRIAQRQRVVSGDAVDGGWVDMPQDPNTLIWTPNLAGEEEA